MSRILAKLTRSSTDGRPTRFHTQEGGLPPFTASLWFPFNILPWIGWQVFGKRPAFPDPWLPPGDLVPQRRGLGGVDSLIVNRSVPIKPPATLAPAPSMC